MDVPSNKFELFDQTKKKFDQTNLITFDQINLTVWDQLKVAPLYGVLGSWENGSQNNQGAGSSVGKSLGSREQGN